MTLPKQPAQAFGILVRNRLGKGNDTFGMGMNKGKRLVVGFLLDAAVRQ
jgi:hypothetical protein